MNTTTMRTMIAAAALVVAAGSASAQTFKAEIPMAFQVGNKTMAAGSYDISLSGRGAGQRLVVSNWADNSSATLVTRVTSDPPKAWRAGDAKIAFACTDGVCSLQTFWNGTDSIAYQYPTQKATGTLTAHRSELVTLSMIKTR